MVDKLAIRDEIEQNEEVAEVEVERMEVAKGVVVKGARNGNRRK